MIGINQEQFEQYFVNICIEDFKRIHKSVRRRFQFESGADRFKKEVIGGSIKTFFNEGKVNRNECQLEKSLFEMGAIFSDETEKKKFFNYLGKGAHLKCAGEYNLLFEKVDGKKEYSISYEKINY